MLKDFAKIFLFAILAAFLVGCASKGPSNSSSGNAQLPDWMANPSVEGGIATAECSKWSGDVSMDKAEAAALARATLTKQIQTKVQAMDKTYKRKVGTEKGQSTGSVFSSVSKQVAQKQLKGARVIKQEIVEIGDNKQLCVLMSLNPKKTKKIFNNIVKKSSAKVDPKDKRQLYEEFKSKKAQEQLAKEMEEYKKNQ